MLLVIILIQLRCLLEGGLSLEGEIENFPLISDSIRPEISYFKLWCDRISP